MPTDSVPRRPEPILEESYWRQRLEQARASGELHHAIFKCPGDLWRRIEERHRQILADLVQPSDSILDAGCGWGRLLTLLPADWRGPYLGVDISPDFIALAKEKNPGRSFKVMDLRDLGALPGKMADWAILISVRPMVNRHLGCDAWKLMEAELRRVARKMLFLEYDINDKGSVI